MANSYFTQEKDLLFSTVLSELKALGVKVPKIKKFKSNVPKQEMVITEKDCKIFGKSLKEQEWTSEVEYPLPKFIALATAYLQKFVKQEIGLFRKAGNIARQRHLRIKLERGESFKDEDPNDVASLLKQWLRELPESLIPYYLQDLFIRCNCLDVEKDRVSACLFTILLLPPDHMYTLKHLLRFLSLISSHSNLNKMGIHNLAVIMAPNIFATNESAEKMNTLLNDYTAILHLLIENSDKIGEAPSSICQRRFLGAEWHASLDTLNSGSSQYKRKSGPVQDFLYGFKKLVGHNNSLSTWKINSEDNFLETPKFPRQTLSLVNLGSPDFVTPKENEGAIKVEKRTGTHARRKSFGALFLRKKDRKMPESKIQLLVSEVVAKKSNKEKDLPSPENLKNIRDATQNSSNFSNIKFPNSSSKTGKDDFSCLREATSKKSWDLSENSVMKSSSKSSKSCKGYEEIFKTPLPPKICSSTLKSEKGKSHGKFGLTRQEAFSIKPIKQKIENTENVQIKPKEFVKSSNSICSHSQKSLCNTKCDKNKSENCERLSDKRQEFGYQIQLKKKNSLLNTVSSCDASETEVCSSKTSDSMEENKGLDLSLKLKVHNFCVSNGSSEIKFRIDIEASNSNPELKLNKSQKEMAASENNIPTSQTHPTSGNRTNKTRAQLSSQSDSKIPRLKKRSNRPKSFTGSITESKHRAQHLREISKRYSTKIPIVQIAKKEESVQVQNYSSPHSISESWMDDTSKYWNTPKSTRKETFNKREKENPGYGHAKLSLFNVKHKIDRSSDGIRSELFESKKLIRTSSEKYPRDYWVNRSKLCATKSCSSNQVTAHKSKPSFEKSHLPNSSESPLKELNTPSQRKIC